MCSSTRPQSYLNSKIKLWVPILPNNDNIYLFNSFKWVLPQNVRDIVELTSILFHMGCHIKVEVFSCWILNFVSLECMNLIFCFYGHSGVDFPFTLAIFMNSLFIALGKEWTFFGNSISNNFWSLKVDSNVRIIRSSVNIDIERMSWIRIEYFVHAHTVFAELSSLTIVSLEILASNILLDESSIDVSSTTNLFECWCKFKLSIIGNFLFESIRA